MFKTIEFICIFVFDIFIFINQLPKFLNFIVSFKGPMVYGACYCPATKTEILKNIGFAGVLLF